MALYPFCYFLAFLTLLPTLSTSKSYHEPNTSLKSLHVTLYEHIIMNKTDFLIVQGIPQPGANSSMVLLPIGTMFVLREPITHEPNPSSELVGFIEAISTTTSFDGLDNLEVGKITFSNLKGYKGSISVLGSVRSFEPSDIPVVGGTGDFLFVQGFITSSHYSNAGDGVSFVYKLEFHLYWPPYAAKEIKG